MKHHYIERDTRRIKAEQFYGDEAVRFLYSRIREQSLWLFQRLVSARTSRILSYMNYDGILAKRMANYLDIQRQLNIDPAECMDPVENLNSLRKYLNERFVIGPAVHAQRPCAVVCLPPTPECVFGVFLSGGIRTVYQG